MTPIIHIEEKTLAKAWETAIVSLWLNGKDIDCQWQDRDTSSKDCTLILRIEEPLDPPQIHLGMPCGLEELLMYVEEVVNGVHDHWINPEEKKWLYSYHDRLRNYYVGQYESIDQITTIIDTLEKCPHSRRAIASTWQPGIDSIAYDCPCLQSIQCRILDRKLHMTIHIRSNDAWGASFMNMYAFIQLQKYILHSLIDRGLRIKMGSYTHIATSYHFYDKDFPAIEKFIEALQQRSFEERTWDECDPRVVAMMSDARDRVQEALVIEKETGKKGL